MKIKKTDRRYKIAYLFLHCIALVIVTGYAQESKSRILDKTFEMTGSTKLEVENSFGKIHVNNWDKNELNVRVEVVAEASDARGAQAILDRIEIEYEVTGSVVYFKTELNKINTRNKEKFEVNYTINMPGTGALKLENSFGDIYIPDRGGDVELDVSYGSLQAGKLSSSSDIKVSFGSAKIDEIARGEAEIKYSDVEISVVGTVNLEQGFSDLEIETAEKLEIESKYGSLVIGRVGELDVDIQYSDFEIEELTGYLYMESEYVSGFKIDKVNKSFSGIDIDGKFGNYKINLAPAVRAYLDAEFEFSDLRTQNLDIEYTYRVKEGSESEYRAKIGGGNESSGKIKIRSSYGDCTIRSN